MNDLKDIIWALLQPVNGVRLPRLIKEIYLVDWKCAFEYPPRPCTFKWIYGPCGPTSEKIEECVRQNSDMFRIEEVQTQSGVGMFTVYRQNMEYVPKLTDGVASAIDLVIRVAAQKSWEELTLLISSTYPIMQSSMLDTIDIERYAKEYREILGRRRVIQDELPTNLG